MAANQAKISESKDASLRRSHNDEAISGHTFQLFEIFKK